MELLCAESKSCLNNEGKWCFFVCFFSLPPDFDALLGGEVGGVEFGKLPFGACEDPIR